MAKHPELHIKNYSAISESAAKYLYNFWDTEFKDNTWLGEDVKFCDLTRAGFKFHALVDGETTIMEHLVIKELVGYISKIKWQS